MFSPEELKPRCAPCVPNSTGVTPLGTQSWRCHWNPGLPTPRSWNHDTLLQAARQTDSAALPGTTLPFPLCAQPPVLLKQCGGEELLFAPVLCSFSGLLFPTRLFQTAPFPPPPSSPPRLGQLPPHSSLYFPMTSCNDPSCILLLCG